MPAALSAPRAFGPTSHQWPRRCLWSRLARELSARLARVSFFVRLAHRQHPNVFCFFLTPVRLFGFGGSCVENASQEVLESESRVMAHEV